ncbi:MAG: potassium-transporting ATPase subunit KdpC [Sulfuricurvum sp.]|uniref:potassium-transporting ATPase subunit KdpC n=1 Tax=Sulfuricurvum sp. TaxID=2025608 RepID=UPI00262A1718|nr:potassium-transporting ATPase subunit KdpC [Sulfuricurvum sp.]MDD2837317.1 potassium-transporting ATPase subunit KdpC [Sulfuricurvum sp.]MDD3595790.1 potassium-transporting ATPase subunit KdpC [Sulfuricurvum sp.]
MFKELEKSVILFTSLALICGVAYPLTMNAIGNSAFTPEAKGSLVYEGKTPIASTLIAQNFTQPQYFHPRPSMAGSDGYDGASSSGSNLGYTSQKLHDAVKERVEAYRSENNLSISEKVPMDAVTASASGLDPHISVANATIQAKRVAASRGIDESKVMDALHKNAQKGYWGIIGEEKVNVVTLNLTLDREFGKVKI